MSAGADGPEYGPGGYLPPRAAHRARKIILRERMGLGWPVAAIVAAVLVALAGVVYLRTATGPPGPPHVAVGALEAIDPRGAAVLDVPGAEAEALVVRSGGVLRTFAAPATPVHYCAPAQRLEGADGTVWTVDGRRAGGPGASLQPMAAEVHDGVIYADPSALGDRPPPVGEDAAPQCAPP